MPTIKLRSRIYHTLENVNTLRTPGRFRRAFQRNQTDHIRVNNAFIARGHGNWHNADIEAASKRGDTLSIEWITLTAESRALGYHAERWFGMPPYQV